MTTDGFELLEHTADEGLRIWAPTLDELFAVAGRAVIAVMGHAPGPNVHERRVELDAPDLDALLVDWMSEMLYLFEVHGIVPVDVEVRITEDPVGLEAVVRGPDAEGLEQDGPQVKAITYHGLQLRRTADGWEAVVYVDV